MLVTRGLWDKYGSVVAMSYLLTKGVDLISGRFCETIGTFYFLTTIGSSTELIHLRNQTVPDREHLTIQHHFDDHQSFAKYDYIYYPPHHTLTYLAGKVINSGEYLWLKRLVSDHTFTIEEQLSIYSLGWIAGNQQIRHILNDIIFVTN